jgi:hypothetical protein
MRGVLPLAVELWTFGSPGGLQIFAFSKCWASPPHLAKVGLRQSTSTSRQQGNGGQLLATTRGKPQEVEPKDHWYQEGDW